MAIKDMLGRSGLVSREDALKILDEHLLVPALPSEDISLSSAAARVLAQDIVSPVDLPDFDRSTMDGYAVRSADTFGAAESRPALLSVSGDIPMGSMPERGIAKGEAMKIATGGALPAAADAVVMFEYTQPVDDKSIEVVKPAAPFENVIQRGDDIRKGEMVLARGHRIRPQDMAALAGIGATRVPVFEKPSVAIISTGNEIVPAESEPGPGRIRDTNSYDLEGLITLAGGLPQKFGIIPDDFSLLRTTLQKAVAECRLVLLTGGSSVGTADLTAKVINEFGVPGVLVHGVAIKPGKPLIIGFISVNNAPPVPVFGLPGHPAAVRVCFDLFVRRVLVRLTGEVAHPALGAIPAYRTVRVRLARSISSGPGREEYVRVMLEKRDDGIWARPVFGASGLITTLVKSAGIVVIPENKIGIEAGEEVEVRLF